jgi:phospholipid/cholesterol/gamma-HCH transport system substrate-binding protein
METKAHYVTVGLFVLLMSIGVMIFLVWAAEVGPDRDYDYYTINFDTPITGISRNSNVRYKGIGVGSVDSIQLDENRPGRIRVVIRVFLGTPIDNYSVASVDTLGLTGGTFIQISDRNGDEVSGPRTPLVARAGEEYPEIPYKVTGLSGLMASAPELLAQGTELLARGNRILRDENILLIDQVIADVATITGGVASKTEDIQLAIVALRSSMERIDRITASVEDLTDTELAQLMGDFADVATNVKQLTGSLDAMINENRTAITTFTSTALPEVSQLVTDTRRLVQSLSRIAEKLEGGPAEFIFPPKKPEIEAAE